MGTRQRQRSASSRAVPTKRNNRSSKQRRVRPKSPSISGTWDALIVIFRAVAVVIVINFAVLGVVKFLELRCGCLLVW